MNANDEQFDTTTVDPSRANRHDSPGRFIRNVKDDAIREKAEAAESDQGSSDKE